VAKANDRRRAVKKQFVRVAVYVTVLGVPALMLSNPYYRQSIFGPKIRGVPVYAWQHDTRVWFGAGRNNRSLTDRALAMVGIHPSPTYIDNFMFPSLDPEMLPVLISLADDSDDDVRQSVAYYLGYWYKQDEVATTLRVLANDPVRRVSDQAQISLARRAKEK
jgi:hypothetical protein